MQEWLMAQCQGCHRAVLILLEPEQIDFDVDAQRCAACLDRMVGRDPPAPNVS
jgi:hypothetical protein